MTELLYSPKIKPEHLARKAIVYLRQSSEKQVRYNLESQRLQYEVADRIRNLGWRDVEIIDSDLGSSAGMAAARREGFERVLSLVALGEIGIVGSREVSRLSRTDKDWCRSCRWSPMSSLHVLIPVDPLRLEINQQTPQQVIKSIALETLVNPFWLEYSGRTQNYTSTAPNTFCQSLTPSI